MRDTFRSYRVFIDNQQSVNNSDKVVTQSRPPQRYSKRRSNSYVSDKEKAQVENARKETADPIYVSDGKWQNRDGGRGFRGRNSGGRDYGRNRGGRGYGRGDRGNDKYSR